VTDQPADAEDPAEVTEVTVDQGRALLDAAARRHLRISGQEFLRRHRAGTYRGATGDLHVKVERVAALLPFAGEQQTP